MSAKRNNAMNDGAFNARDSRSKRQGQDPYSKKMKMSQQELDRRAARQTEAAGRASAEYEAQKKYTESIPAPTSNTTLTAALNDMSRQRSKMARKQRRMENKTITTASGKKMNVSVDPLDDPTKNPKKVKSPNQSKGSSSPKSSSSSSPAKSLARNSAADKRARIKAMAESKGGEVK